MLGARLDLEESLRFYAHWLHEFWTIRPPNAIIAEGTDCAS
jgi:hypothetical protein